MHREAMIERTERCTWRPRSSEYGDALGGRDLLELGDALGGGDRVSMEIHLEDEI